MGRRFYEPAEVDEMLNDTRGISKDPYKLFAAFFLTSIYDEYFYEDEDDVGMDLEVIWGNKIPQRQYEATLNECVIDFICAIKDGLMVYVLGSEYHIRNTKIVTEENLRSMFNFRKAGESVILDKKLIVDFSSIPKTTLKEKLEYGKDNKSYFKKIVWLACHDRYDDLTDIEAAAYCFALHFAKNPENNIGKSYFLQWYHKWEDYFLLSKDIVLACLEDDVRYPQYYFSFAARKIREENKASGQKSVVDSVNEKEADDYWYDVATKKKFK